MFFIDRCITKRRYFQFKKYQHYKPRVSKTPGKKKSLPAEDETEKEEAMHKRKEKAKRRASAAKTKSAFFKSRYRK